MFATNPNLVDVRPELLSSDLVCACAQEASPRLAKIPAGHARLVAGWAQAALAPRLARRNLSWCHVRKRSSWP